jgi:hypothetical protein
MRQLRGLAALAGVAFFTCLSVAQALPDGRVYERVSPLDTNGESPNTVVPAPGGESLDFQSGAFGEAAVGGSNLYQATRTATGWQTRALTPKNLVQPQIFSQSSVVYITPDLSQAIFATPQPWEPGDQDSGALDIYEDSSQGKLTWVSQGTQGAGETGAATFQGATPDATHVVFDSPDSLLPAAPVAEEMSFRAPKYLYERDLTTDQTSLVNVDEGGAPLNGEGAILGNGNDLETGLFGPQLADDYGTTTHAISADGSKIFFETPIPGIEEYALTQPSQRTVHLYMREHGNRTVPLDDPSIQTGAGARYMGASENGKDVFFLSDEGLAGSEFTDPELYVYDTEAEKLTLISGAPAGEPAVDGAVYGVTAISNDGSHVYYVARGVLAGNTNSEGQRAVTGEPNLYVYDTATQTNTFIAQLGSGDVETAAGRIGRLVSYLDLERPAVPTPDGQVLVFTSVGDLTGQNSGGVAQVYRYDAVSGELLCISCGPGATGKASLGIGQGAGGSIEGGSYDPQSASAPMSADGEQIFFETESSLLPEDRNGGAEPIGATLLGVEVKIPFDIDVYEWNAGRLSLISDGQPGLNSLLSVTPDAHDVFIDTSVDLEDGRPTTTGEVTLYDARVGGGFPAASDTGAAPCESGTSCRGPAAGLPTFTTPGSVASNPVTNVPPPAVVKAKPKVKPKASRKTKKKKKKAATKAKRAKTKQAGKKAKKAKKRSAKAGRRAR